MAQIKAVLGKGIDEGHTRLQHDDNVQQAVDRRKAGVQEKSIDKIPNLSYIVDEASSNKGDLLYTIAILILTIGLFYLLFCSVFFSLWHCKGKMIPQ